MLSSSIRNDINNRHRKYEYLVYAAKVNRAIASTLRAQMYGPVMAQGGLADQHLEAFLRTLPGGIAQVYASPYVPEDAPLRAELTAAVQEIAAANVLNLWEEHKTNFPALSGDQDPLIDIVDHEVRWAPVWRQGNRGWKVPDEQKVPDYIASIDVQVSWQLRIDPRSTGHGSGNSLRVALYRIPKHSVVLSRNVREGSHLSTRATDTTLSFKDSVMTSGEASSLCQNAISKETSTSDNITLADLLGAITRTAEYRSTALTVDFDAASGANTPTLGGSIYPKTGSDDEDVFRPASPPPSTLASASAYD